MIFIKIILVVLAIVVLYYILQDVKANLEQLKESDTSNFKGAAIPIQAVVADKKRFDLRSGNGAGPAMANLNEFQLIYEVNGVSYTKDVGLLDKGNSLKNGDIVDIMYDSANPEKAVMADGSEADSAKNGLKLDVGIAVCEIIVGMIIFFVVLN